MTPAIYTPEALRQVLREDAHGDFHRKFERACFSFSHSLAGNPLFLPNAIVNQALAAPDSVYFDLGDIRVGDRWDQLAPPKRSAVDAIRNIDNSGAWCFLNHVERNPEYGFVLDQFLQEAEDLAALPFRRKSRSQEMIIFLTSPHRVTPYHMDRECNFLLQTSGTKLVHTFDGADRSVVSEQELERFWAFDKNGAAYKEANQAKAISFEIAPGNGVHVPVNFPHWVQNGPEVSVSVSISVQFYDRDRADVYRANHLLRRLGITPRPRGQSPFRDALKRAFYAQRRNLRDFPFRKRNSN